ncbi:MAG TPA: GNAT family N-acetyltransferase [Allosphingosinicella sp.]|nr:GNAT family N-acetyltransferase [Allosphingosinicella sp.]
MRVAWRRDDPRIEADAIEMWRRHDLLPEDVDPRQRAKELIAASYKDGQLAAIATATIGDIDFLRARFAIIRGATAPEFRRGHAQLSLSVPSREALWSWARAHPEEKLAGGIVFVDRGEWGDFTRLPVWPESELEVVGYDQHGRQIRVRWFEDFRYEEGPPPPPLPAVPAGPPPGIEVRNAWQTGDAGIERDAAAFWRRLGNLPAEVNPEERAKEVVLAAYSEGRMVGVVTASIGLFERVRARVAMLRGSVDPDHRRSHVGGALFPRALAILEAWAAAHPGERVAGVGGILESRELASIQRIPYWPQTRFHLIGFTPDGRQIRLRWFRDFVLD